MEQQTLSKLGKPRFQTADARHVAGKARQYGAADDADDGIPEQWKRFMAQIGKVPGKVDDVAYGVIRYDDNGGFEYLAGVEVADFSGLPSDLDRVSLPAGRYVVFAHREHVSKIKEAWAAVWNEWFPQSDHEAADAPPFERYGEQFDPATGRGDIELWVPLKT